MLTGQTYLFSVNFLPAIIPDYLDGSFLMSPECAVLNLAKWHFYILYFLFRIVCKTIFIWKNCHHIRHSNITLKKWSNFFFHFFIVLFHCAKCQWFPTWGLRTPQWCPNTNLKSHKNIKQTFLDKMINSFQLFQSFALFVNYWWLLSLWAFKNPSNETIWEGKIPLCCNCSQLTSTRRP